MMILHSLKIPAPLTMRKNWYLVIVRIPSGMGFCTWDHVRPETPGLYIFNARALQRDGSAIVRWANPGTTEITSICNEFLCELISPQQWLARITLTGQSAIHLESDFYSEFTNVTLRYNNYTFDITDLCRIEQYPSSSKNHIVVNFNTRDLPIGPRTWAYYTIQLHPMPVVPEGAKLSDSLWIRTNGRD